MATSSVLRVLVVEDEPLVAIDIEASLRRHGHRVVGPAYSLETGLHLARHEALDAAVLDIALAAESSVPIAELLAGRHIPFVFISGYSRNTLPDHLQVRPFLRKPFAPGTLLGLIGTTITAPQDRQATVPP